jgi:hypothetical protein
MEYKKNVRGLGDTISNVIKNVSGGRIKECGGCGERREWLNDKVSYTRHNALAAIQKIQNGNIR